MKYLSKAEMKQPSKKSILHEPEISLERIHEKVEKLRDLFNDAGLGLPPAYCDPILLKETIKDAFNHEEVGVALSYADLGMGFLLGTAMTLLQYNDEDREEE